MKKNRHSHRPAPQYGGQGYEFKSDWEEEGFNLNDELGEVVLDNDWSDDPFARLRVGNWERNLGQAAHGS